MRKSAAAAVLLALYLPISADGQADPVDSLRAAGGSSGRLSTGGVGAGPAEGRLGLYRKEVRVEAYGREGLRMSDVELAWRISEGEPADKFSKGKLRVIPMPTRTYRKGQNVFVYYEIYNLARDDRGQTNYRVEYTVGPREGGIISRLVRTFVSKGEKVAVGYERRGFGDSEAAHMELDLGACEPGRHDLRVEVTDLNTGQKATKNVAFVVVE